MKSKVVNWIFKNSFVGKVVYVVYKVLHIISWWSRIRSWILTYKHSNMICRNVSKVYWLWQQWWLFVHMCECSTWVRLFILHSHPVMKTRDHLCFSLTSEIEVPSTLFVIVFLFMDLNDDVSSTFYLPFRDFSVLQGEGFNQNSL